MKTISIHSKKYTNSGLFSVAVDQSSGYNSYGNSNLVKVYIPGVKGYDSNAVH